MVLIAEDEPAIRRLVRATIDSDEYELLEAGDGDEAWRLIEEHRPAVVLLDLRMPGRDGLALARAIRERPDLGDTRVILLTGERAPATVDEAQHIGVDLFLTKPFSPLQLLTAVRAAVLR